MIGLDTNLIVRLIVEDDLAQSERARQYIQANCSSERPGFINRVTLCEVVWVLKTGYGFDREKIAAVVKRVSDAVYFMVEDADHVRRALDRFERAAVDFADALVAETNRDRGCSATATFDRKAVRLSGFVRVP
jgi:predicted nucleic-acid-binding protein